jgi:hypothetical protein
MKMTGHNKQLLDFLSWLFQFISGFQLISFLPMQVKDALQMFQDLVGYSFPYCQCWLILRNEKKWCDWLASLSIKDKDTKVSGGEAAPKLAPTSTEERPMGRDRAKKLKRVAS